MNIIRFHFGLYFLLLSTTIFAQINIQLITDSASPRFGQLQITNVDFPENWKQEILSQKDWNSIFLIQFGKQVQENLPSMLGKYEVQESTIFFQPRFPFTQGKHYTAKFSASMFNQKTALNILNKDIIYTFQVPVLKEIKTTYVQNVYPSETNLPMNQLKLYLYFSDAMRAGQAFDYLKLLDATGAVVKDPFLYMEKELWDKDRKRLTIWFDPGRIKRNLSPHQLLGLPLQAGQSYQLVVDKNWLDLNGNPLKDNYIKSFQVIESDRKMPKTTDWKLNYPAPNTEDILSIDFGESMDMALLQHSLAVFDDENNRIAGKIKITNMEKEWQFIPEQPWKAGHYKIKIATILEDLAGNNLNNLFDRNLQVDAATIRNRDEVDLDFTLIHP